MAKGTPLAVKRKCCEMKEAGMSSHEIYDSYYKHEVESPMTRRSFRTVLVRWAKKNYPDDTTLECGTYEGFVAHDATVQVAANGEIIQAWIKQHAETLDPEEFLAAIKTAVQKYEYVKPSFKDSKNMLEISLFDMHWGIAFMDYYKSVLNDVLEIITSHH